MKIRRKVASLLLIILMFGSVFDIAGSIFAGELSDAEQERQRLAERQNEINEELAELQNDQSGLLESIDKLDKKLEKVSTQMDELNAQIDDVNQELVVIGEQLLEAKNLEETQYDIMKKRIKYMYENSSSGYVELLASAKNVNDFINRAEYINKIASYDKNMHDKYEAAKEEVERKQQEANDKKDELQTLKDELKVEQESLEKMQKHKKKRLEKYEEQIANNEAAAKELEKEIAKQEKKIMKLLLEMADKEGSGETGTYIWPLSVPGRISSHFGPRKAPTAGASTFHKGLDIAAPAGTSIFAVADGTVTTAAYSNSAGNYVMINHGNGVYTAYMHCSRLYVEVGDEVKQGDRIAAVGSTGISTGAHLHISFIINGTYMNPENFLPEP